MTRLVGILRHWDAVLPYVIHNVLFGSSLDCKLPPLSSLDREYEIVYPCGTERLNGGDYARLEIDCHRYVRLTESGQHFAIIFHRGKAVHRSLVQFEGYASMEGDPRAFRLRAREAYVHYCLTAPEHRGRSVYPHALQTILRTELAGEVSRVWIACARANQNSVRGILKAGFEYKRSSVAYGALRGRLVIRHWYVDPGLGGGAGGGPLAP